VSTAKIHDAATTEEPPHPPGDLPRLVELFAWETPCVAHGARDAIEEGLTGEAAEVVGRGLRGSFRSRDADQADHLGRGDADQADHSVGGRGLRGSFLGTRITRVWL
jgi:hypothetical protein